MKIPLRYQLTEYDCGSTSMENAISYLFDREEVPPIIVKHIMICCMDSFNSEGEFAKGGTSRIAMQYLSGWLNSFARAYQFPIHCECLIDDKVSIAPDGPIIGCLRGGGAVVLRVRYEVWHYVLLTGADREFVYLFDPYYRSKPFDTPKIQVILDQPMRLNRKVPYEFLDTEEDGIYALGPKSERDAVMICNTAKMKTQPSASAE